MSRQDVPLGRGPRNIVHEGKSKKPTLSRVGFFLSLIGKAATQVPRCSLQFNAPRAGFLDTSEARCSCLGLAPLTLRPHLLERRSVAPPVSRCRRPRHRSPDSAHASCSCGESDRPAPTGGCRQCVEMAGLGRRLWRMPFLGVGIRRAYLPFFFAVQAIDDPVANGAVH